MSADQLSNPDLFKRLAARGLEVSDQTKDSAFSDMDGEGILVSTVGSGGTTQVVNSDGSAFVSPFPREAGLHAYAATAAAGAGTVIATVTPTVVGVYEVVINAKVSAGSSGEAVLDNMQLRNNGTAVMRLLTNPVAISSAWIVTGKQQKP